MTSFCVRLPHHFAIEAVAESDPGGQWLTCFAREEKQA